MNDKVEEHYPNGNLKSTVPSKDGIKHGHMKMYYESGELMYQGECENGNQEGVWKLYYENGTLKRENVFENHEKTSLKEYNEYGQILYEEQNKDELLHGTQKYYYENGQLKSEHIWKDNKKNGVSKTYYENGQLKKEGKYNGEEKFNQEELVREYGKEGVWKQYYENGNLEKEEVWEGWIKTSETNYDKNGKVLRKEDGSLRKRIEKDLYKEIEVIFNTSNDYNLSGFGENGVTVNISREKLLEVMSEIGLIDEDDEIDEYLLDEGNKIDLGGLWFEIMEEYTDIESVCVIRTRIKTKYLQNYEGDCIYLERRELETINFGMSFEEKTKNPELQTKLDKQLNHDYYLQVKMISGLLKTTNIEDKEEIKKLEEIFTKQEQDGGIFELGGDLYHIEKFNLKDELNLY